MFGMSGFNYVHVIGLIIVISCALGFYGVLFKERINNSVHYQMSLHYLLAGFLLLPILPFYIIFGSTTVGMQLFDDETTMMIILLWFSISLLVWGIYGVVKKKVLDDKESFFTTQAIYTGSAGVISIIYLFISKAMHWGHWRQ